VNVSDTTPPTVTLSSAAPSSVTGAITVDAALTEPSVNFAQGDVTTSNAAVSNFSGSGTSYSFTLTPAVPGTFTAQVNAGTFTDNVANANTASNVLSRGYNLAQIWVDTGYFGTELGTQAQPFNTLAEGIAGVAASGTLKVKGNTAEHPRITKALRLEANTAPTRIGGTSGLLARNVKDSDGDGLPNWWELQHGLNPKDATGDNGALGDPDNDGIPNAEEYQDGSDPNQNDAKALPAATMWGYALLALIVIGVGTGIIAALTKKRGVPGIL
jgi:hypothetical protein